MDPEAAGTPWSILIAGLVALAYGIALTRGAAWIGTPLSARERRGSAVMLISLGAAWLFLFWTQTWPFYNQLKPYLVIILATALWPAATAGFIGWFIYFGVIRLFKNR